MYVLLSLTERAHQTDAPSHQHDQLSLSPSLSLSHSLPGTTPSWMAPEIIKNHGGDLSWKKADVWSLGCTTLEMTTGDPITVFHMQGNCSQCGVILIYGVDLI